MTFLNIDIPETENHLLMIESSRYLVNQLLHDRSPHDPRFNNAANGLSGWLLGYRQIIARHDFLEFNSRSYARLSLHALYNLHEFARAGDQSGRAHPPRLHDDQVRRLEQSRAPGEPVQAAAAPDQPPG